MSNSLDLERAQDFVESDLGPKCLQKLSADDKVVVKGKFELEWSKICHRGQ